MTTGMESARLRTASRAGPSGRASVTGRAPAVGLPVGRPSLRRHAPRAAIGEGGDGPKPWVSRITGPASGASALGLAVFGGAPPLLPPLGRDGGGGDGGGGGGGPAEVALLAAEDEDHSRKRRKKKKTITLTLASFAVTKMARWTGERGRRVGAGRCRKAAASPVVLSFTTVNATSHHGQAYVRLTRAFAVQYLRDTGIEVAWRLTFAGSGTQSRAVCDGLPADLVALALPLDIEKIAEAGLIRRDWQQRLPNRSVVSESVVAVVTRKGNPRNVRDWGDLSRPDVFTVCANPKTAGAARWSFLALWGHVAGRKGARGPAVDARAERFVTDVFQQVPVQPRDAREASDAFYKQRVGDCLLTYENEVVATNWMLGRSPRTAGQVLPYLVPDRNVRVQNPVAVVDAVVDGRGREAADARDAAEAFLRFLYTEPAQRELARWGFRAVDSKVLRAQATGIEAEAARAERIAEAAAGTGHRPWDAAEPWTGPRVDRLPGASVGDLWSVEGLLPGGWVEAQAKLFDSGQVLDRIQATVGAARRALQASGNLRAAK